MALKRGFGRGMSVQDGRGRSGPRTFWLPPGKGTTLVLLDDDPVTVVRHQLFIKGDKKAAEMRCTCAGFDPEEHVDPVPRQCIACNAAIRDQRIGRRPLAYLTLIDERQFNFKGREYKDMKVLLELDKKGYNLFEHRKSTYGSLIGAQFKVYRSSERNSPRYGDDWQFIQKVDLVRHFWHSPGVPRLIEAEQRRGQAISHQDAVKRLVTPIDYDESMGKYEPAEADRFVAYAEGGEARDQQQVQQQPPPYQAPVQQPYQQQAPAPAAMPDYAVPAGQAPAYAPQPQQTQQPAPAPQPTAAPAPPPPPVPDPATASPLPGGYVAPPMPAPAPGQAPAPTLQQGAPAMPAPAPAPAPTPVQAAPPVMAPGAPAVPGSPAQGWSATPPFPQQTQPSTNEQDQPF